MTQQFVNVGTTNNDGTGDTLRSGAQKINENFTEIYGAFAGNFPLSVVSNIITGDGLTSSKVGSTVNLTARKASETVLGSIRVGNNLSVTEEGVLNVNLPTASASTLGVIRVDGTTITINNGVITAVGGGGGGAGSGNVNSGAAGLLAWYPNSGNTIDDLIGVSWNSNSNILTVTGTLSANTVSASNLSGSLPGNNITGSINPSVLPVATTSTLGGVKVDGTSISIVNGIISATITDITGNAGTVTNGVYTTGNYPNPSWITSLAYSKLTGVPPGYTLPTASTNVLGGVKVDGTTITINNGVITAVGGGGGGGGGGSGTVNLGVSGRLAWYPNSASVVDDIVDLQWDSVTSTFTVFGDITATNINAYINSSYLIGTLNPLVLPTATNSTFGAVRPDTTTITQAAGVLSAKTATSSNLGIVQPDNTSITISNGIISAVAGVNVVQTTGSYSNPSWITSLDYSKITNAPGNLVQTTGSYSNPTWITSLDYSKIANPPTVFSSTFIGTTQVQFNRASGSQTLSGVSISGNAGTVTNGVVTSGSYANPSWITSIDYPKITNVPKANTGNYGIVQLDGTTIYSDGNGVISANYFSRATANVTTASIASGASAYPTIAGFKGYILYSIQTSAAAWVVLYTSAANQSADATRTLLTDPSPGSGVIAEVITTGAQTVRLTPAIFGYNDETPVNDNIYLRVYNNGGGSTAITVTVKLLQIEI